MKGWCAYQERSQHEAYLKLKSFGLDEDEAGNIITRLIGDNFLNEERYAIAFAGGKFRLKKWGRYRIRMELKQQRVSEYCIKKALQQIDEDDYMKTLETLIAKKMEQEKEPDRVKKYYKVLQYAVSKGYEKDLIADVLKQTEP